MKAKTLTVKPSGKKAKIAAIKRGSTVYLVLYVKKGKKYVELDRAKVKRKLPAGASVRLTADQNGNAYEKNGGQGLLGWYGADDSTNTDDFANYFGWNIDKKTIELF